MQHFKKLLIMLLTALFAVPVYVSMAFADVNEESESKAYLIMALPDAVPISQLNNSALIDLRTEEAFIANPIKDASNMGYYDALKAVESGMLDNRALLFVYTTSPKNTYSQDLEDSENSEGMVTYQNEERNGPIRNLISFVLSIFGINRGSTDTGDTGTGIGETPGYGPVEDTENETVGGITGEEVEEPTLPVVGETDEDEMEEPIPPEENNMLGENDNSLLPPLEQITPPVEDNASDTENNTGNQQDVAFNPLLPGNNQDTQDGEETIIPYQQINPNPVDNAQQSMSMEKLTKALNQRGYNFTIIPFN